MNSFWKPRYWIWIGICLFIWLIRGGSQQLTPPNPGLTAQAAFFVGYFGVWLFLIILLEIAYRFITWPFRRKRTKP
jgi:hypothetical protein